MLSKAVNDTRIRLPRRSSGCTPRPEEAEEAVRIALKRLSKLGYRQTPLLHAVLKEMARYHSPVTINELMSLLGIGNCSPNPSSAYRLVKRLETEGIVTHLAVANRAPHYLLAMPGHQHIFLAYKICGVLDEAAFETVKPNQCADCRFAPWTQVDPEICFAGVCPDCTWQE